MNSNSEKIFVALLIAVLFIIFGSATFASEVEEIAPAENIISEEMQALDEEMTEPEPTDIQAVDDEMVDLEPTDDQAVDEEMIEPEPADVQAVDEEIVEPEPTIIPAVTIIGRVADDYILISEQGIAYGIAETEAGDVMGQYIGEKVIAKGIVSMADDQKYISVISFEFVEK